MDDFTKLLNKYDHPVPRYTSYPTVPYWSESPSSEDWLASLDNSLKSKESSWSMYVHIPFCETLCSFCGCNTSITRNKSRGEDYVKILLKEWDNYKSKIPQFSKRPLKQIHLGGGTPNFLSSESFKKLLLPIMQDCNIDKKEFEASIEVDPRRCTIEQLETLAELGFNRISIGVQDFNLEVQKLINRVQSYEKVKMVTEASRHLGMPSVNFDLIYGLPKQSMELFKNTIEQTISLKPDRIALYSLAIVPWIKPSQKLFKDEDLPMGADKRALYEYAREQFLAEGYIEIGMDHFALPTDSLAVSVSDKTLHRNFMGYTCKKSDVLLGLGVSSISETTDCFHQNEKVLTLYQEKVEKSETATLRGHKLNPDDIYYRNKVMEFMTQLEVGLDDEKQTADVKQFLQEMIDDKLVEVASGKLKLTEKGHPFIRNACLVWDQRLRQKKPDAKTFSKSI